MFNPRRSIPGLLLSAALLFAALPAAASAPAEKDAQTQKLDAPKSSSKSSAKKSSGKKKSDWKTSVTVGLETIYDDNFLRYSDDYLHDFHAGTYPWKFQIDRQDTHILAPSIDMYAQRKLISWGNTRFRFKFKRWQYIQGNVKSNMGFDYYIRQYLPKGRSLEFWYNYAPQQYIRELSYRTPLQPPR
ncbi:hypothetical protein H8E07_14010, partial [bacterium]|nr:hypothetical protein [bacterium]